MSQKQIHVGIIGAHASEGWASVLISSARIFLSLCLLLLPLTGCLLRTHKVESRVRSTAPLQEATAQQLIARINTEAEKVKTLNATVDIAASAGGEKKGRVTDYQEIRGYVLLRKPSTLRMIGLYPVVRNMAFDMVSDGGRFRLYIPVKNKFFVGSKDVTTPSKNTLENLRPQHILDAMLVKEIDLQDEIAVVESATELVKDPRSKKDVEQANYILNVVRKRPDGSSVLTRKIYFSRVDLNPTRQVLYGANGNVTTLATYNNFKDQQGVMFPNIIEIERPQEEYKIQLGLVKLTLNQPLTDQQFTLAQPPNVQTVDLDKTSASAATPQTATH
jgi:outer membrane lipoprotein-sorting protein